MAEELDLANLTTRQESPSSLVRFEDDTDKNAPRLNYAVPLPGTFEARAYIECNLKNSKLDWAGAALAKGKAATVLDQIISLVAEISPGDPPPRPPAVGDLMVLSPRRVSRRRQRTARPGSRARRHAAGRGVRSRRPGGGDRRHLGLLR